jgi:hypothetical protein
MGEAKQNATRAISIRVPIADLEQAHRIAEKTGVGYQTALKQAIGRGLKRPAEGGGPSACHPTRCPLKLSTARIMETMFFTGVRA